MADGPGAMQVGPLVSNAIRQANGEAAVSETLLHGQGQVAGHEARTLFGKASCRHTANLVQRLRNRKGIGSSLGGLGLSASPALGSGHLAQPPLARGLLGLTSPGRGSPGLGTHVHTCRRPPRPFWLKAQGHCSNLEP